MTGETQKENEIKVLLNFRNLTIACLICVLLLLAGMHLNDIAKNTAVYPAQSIKFIVPFTPGGSADMMARAMGELAEKHIGMQFDIVNKPGKGAVSGFNAVAGAERDGYTIGYVGTATLLQSNYDQTKYHFPSAIEPLVQVSALPIAIVVLSDQPWQNVYDLITYAKQHPGEIEFGHSGLGATHHIAGEMLAKAAGINIKQMSFQGDAESMSALLGRRIQVCFVMPATAKENMLNGKVRVLAVTGKKRFNTPLFKDIPTFQEQGVDLVLDVIFGIGAPKMIPKERQEKLVEGLEKIINDPEFKANMEYMQMPVDYLGPEAFKKKWNAESTRLAAFIKERGLLSIVAGQKGISVPVSRGL